MIFRSNQLLFKDALTELKKWSDKNTGHTPIIVTINAKDREIPNTRKPLVFDAEALQNIDAEIGSIFSEEKLITPDLVRGNRTYQKMTIAEYDSVYVKGNFMCCLSSVGGFMF